MALARMSDQEQKEFVSIRKAAGLEIDPATAEVLWYYGQVADPYGIIPDLPEELDQVGRTYFARSPGSDRVVSFHDVSESTAKALWQAIQNALSERRKVGLRWEGGVPLNLANPLEDDVDYLIPF
jgi:hypothetical protein